MPTPPPPDLSFITDVFGEGGLLAKRFSTYRPRAGQIEGVEAVARLLEGRDLQKVLMVDAPTGTGKSWMYLAPAVWWLSRPLDDLDTIYDNDGNQMPRKVVVATANLALQDQLVQKDLPMLREVLPWPFTFAVAKGLSNYACRAKLHDLAASPFAEGWRGDEERQYKLVAEWEQTTDKGDISELSEELSPRVRLAVTQTAEECPRRKCEHASECWALKARQAYLKADVVVTNYHLLAADAQADHVILPHHSLFVGDEAHRLPDIFRDCIGDSATAAAFKKAATSLPRGVAARDELELRADEFFHAVSAYADQYLKSEPVFFEVGPELPFAKLDAACRKVESAYEQALGGMNLSTRERQLVMARKDRLSALRGVVGQVMDPVSAVGSVVFVEKDDRRVAVTTRLVDPADFIRETVLRRPHLRATVLTSATLCATPGDFGHISRETGALDSEDLAVESPFDLPSNVLIVVPARLPDPKSQDGPRQVAELLDQIVQLARGRTLGLFTSYRVLRVAAERLERTWRGGEVLVQGTAPRGHLVKRFKEQTSSVLLGTSSLWEGVDVPGEALSCVVIDKLPFVSPNDPVMVKLKERDPKGSFKRDAMPRALRAFRQGCGRLIRSETDRGVVVCLDPRLVDRGFGASFLRTLPGVRVSRSTEDVGNFLDGRPLAGVGGVK